MNLLYTIGAFALALGILIVIHELGHYWVARLCGVKVLRFSVGFGKPIASKVSGPDSTEWALGAFPLGGYVKMLDEREGPVAVTELHRAFNRQPVGKRIAIVLAGPLANFLLAIALYWLLFMVGVPGAKPIVGEPPAQSAAASVGFAKGDEITRIQGEPVSTWQDVRWLLIEHAVEKRTVTIEAKSARGGLVERKLDLSGLSAEDLDGEFVAKLGLTQFRPPIAAVIGKVLRGSAAEKAGMQVGDEVVAIDGERVADWEAMVKVVSAHAGKPLALELRRDGRTRSLSVTPIAEQPGKTSIGRIGVGPKIDENAMKQFFVEIRHDPFTAFAKAVGKTWETSIFSLKMLGKMLTGAISWKNLSGPLTIADYAGQTAQMGWLPYVSFIALISISLGVLNLLPIPLLDGGHLMYYIIELIKGGPVPERIMEIGQQIGMAILLCLMLFAFYNDINRLIAG
jgi:regulator of sigma E protease